MTSRLLSSNWKRFEIIITESSKRVHLDSHCMETGREWILIITLAVSILLGFVGVFMYPLNEQSILIILSYEGLLILGAFGILRLIQKRALEDW